MKQRSLMNKSLTQFIICVAVLLLLATPLFYWLTKSFYAEDMNDIIEAVRQGHPLPSIDMESDIMQGIMLQFALIVSVMGVAIVLTLRLISKRLWKPFDTTLETLETFKLEKGMVPKLPECDVEEFDRLNNTLDKLMTKSVKSYQLQREFTENASHELQTPLAVFQSKLDVLLQLPGITEQQAHIIQDLYQMNGRLSRLSRNLLLLAKMENNQYDRATTVDVVNVVNELRAYLETLADGLTLNVDCQVANLNVKGNRSLLESMVNNMVVNAVRHNKHGGTIDIVITSTSLTIANTSDEPRLDRRHIFNRFYRPTGNKSGNGLGLAIVKAVCDYHDWNISYSFGNGVHTFTVKFC